ncbi:hypothetical protein ACLMJK_000789 [Lecanora helva]
MASSSLSASTKGSSQNSAITGAPNYQTTETSSYFYTVTLRSDMTYTYTAPDGEVVIEAGSKVVTELDVETYHRTALASTASKSFYPWDPQQVSDLWWAQQSERTGSAWASYTSYARQLACSEDFSKFLATQPATGITSLNDDRSASDIQTNEVQSHCCGSCEFVYISVQLFYWPAEHSNTACYASVGTPAETASATLQPKLRGRGENASITAAPKGLGYAVDEDGFTYTSPSIYIKFPSLSAGDRCGPLGVQSYTSATLSFSPGELSTPVD